MRAHIEDKRTALMSWVHEAFAAHSHGKDANDFIKHFKQSHRDKFLARGLPSSREEGWKYADLGFFDNMAFAWPASSIDEETCRAIAASRAANSTLLVFINGQFSQALSSTLNLPQGVMMLPLREALKKHATLITPYLVHEISAEKHPLACLNTALFSDGAFIYVPKNVMLDAPVHLLSMTTSAEQTMTQPRHLIVMENDSHMTLTEEYVALEGTREYFTNVVLDLYVGRNALLNYYKVEQEGAHAKHFSHAFLHQKQHSFVNACLFSLGGQAVRHEMTVALQEKHARCQLNGFYGLSRDKQWIDHHLFVDHAAPYTESQIDFYGVAAKKSRAVFNGHVRVQREARKTVAEQYNHNILLSPLAEVNTKPDLEIYADEIACRHGATVGQLDEEAVFYLATRGLDKGASTALLLQAFMEKAIGKLTLPWLSDMLRSAWGLALAELI